MKKFTVFLFALLFTLICSAWSTAEESEKTEIISGAYMYYLLDDGTAEIIKYIGLSSRLGMASLTEGVETQAQYDSLMKMGCQMYQGYYFAKPMPEGDFDQLLSRERQRH